PARLPVPVLVRPLPVKRGRPNSSFRKRAPQKLEKNADVPSSGKGAAAERRRSVEREGRGRRPR
ncbi:MAG: hypothetical protein BJ554DRAFT_6105, partial [Olpidium bornovanus]